MGELHHILRCASSRTLPLRRTQKNPYQAHDVFFCIYMHICERPENTRVGANCNSPFQMWVNRNMGNLQWGKFEMWVNSQYGRFGMGANCNSPLQRTQTYSRQYQCSMINDFCSLFTFHFSLFTLHYLPKGWIIESFLVVLLTQAVDGRWSAPQQQAELGDAGALLAG